MKPHRRSTDKYLLPQSTHRMFGELRADMPLGWLPWMVSMSALALMIVGAVWEIAKGAYV